MAGERLRLHAYLPHSRANGPGVRAALWVQGCSLGCTGCFNPKTHDVAGDADELEVDALVDRLVALGDTIEGVTISGGEPLEQPAAVLALATAVRARTALSLIVFSGYAIDEIRAMPLGPALLDQLDVLIDGRYVAGERRASGLRGSHNQRIWCLTHRYDQADIEATPEAEVHIGSDGTVTLSGVAPLPIRRR